MHHTQEAFEHEATDHPLRFVERVRSGEISEPAALTFAAEALSRVTPTSLAVAALLPLLAHREAIVREGAIYGIGPHLEASAAARDALRGMLEDPSPGVRAAVRDALQGLD
jgi:HEAT repeat protein